MTFLSWQGFLTLIIIAVCCILMIVILLQRGRGGGLAGAFGGAGGTAAFGAKTGDVFTWITVVVATVFVLLAVVANFAFDMSKTPVVTPPPAPAPAAGTVVPAEEAGEEEAAPVERQTGVPDDGVPPEGGGIYGLEPETKADTDKPASEEPSEEGAGTPAEPEPPGQEESGTDRPDTP